MKHAFLLSLAILVALRAPAETEALRKIVSTRSLPQLHAVLQQATNLDETRAICRAQLDGGKIPTRCFDVLNGEKNLRLLGAGEFARETTWMNELCLKRTSESYDRAELNAKPSASLPESCRLAIKERAEDLRYGDQIENPGDLFERRFRKDPPIGTSVRSKLKIHIH